MTESENDEIRLHDPLAGKLYTLLNQQRNYFSQPLSLLGPGRIPLCCLLSVPHYLSRDGTFFL